MPLLLGTETRSNEFQVNDYPSERVQDEFEVAVLDLLAKAAQQQVAHVVLRDLRSSHLVNQSGSVKRSAALRLLGQDSGKEDVEFLSTGVPRTSF